MSAAEHDPRELNLPKWARARLDFLRRRLREEEARADEARLASNPDGSDAIIDPYDDYPIGLGRGTQVRFFVGGQSEWIDVRVVDGELKLVASGCMQVTPYASNHVTVSAR